MAQICKFFPRCGGCTLQHVPYESQASQKLDRVRRELAKSGIKLNGPVDIVKSNPFGYRNRMDFVFASRGLGHREKGRYDHIVSVDQCPIAEKHVNKLLSEVRQWHDPAQAFDVRKGKGTLRYAVIRGSSRTGSTSISFVVNPDSHQTSEVVQKIRDWNTSATNMAVTYVPKREDQSVSEDFFMVKGDKLLTERIGKLELRFSIQGFFQSNTAVAEKMVGWVDSRTDGGSQLVDLYGGVGLFGLSLHERFDRTAIIESSKESIQAAIVNISKVSAENCDAYLEDAARIYRHADLFDSDDVTVVTDPPRGGMHQRTLAFLLHAVPKRIFYVSCNPSSMSRELSLLKARYHVSEASAFDMFPQTNHVETIVLLEKD